MPTLRLLTVPLVVASFSLSGCALDRGPIVAVDGGPGLDAPVADAPLADTFDLDAPGLLDDAAPDAGPPCVMTSAIEVACDRIDDDCDAAIDDDGVCSGCTAFTISGRAYLSCPGPESGMGVWSGACRTSAPGYDLVVFSSGEERSAVVTALAGLGISSPHWIGLNDFDVSGTYLWLNHAPTFTPTTIGSDDPAKRFVTMRNDGTYEELTGTDTNRFLCEIVVGPGACRSAAESATCDGIDDDCNGVVDDGIDCGGRGCTSSTFWDRVYYACTSARNHGEARGHCTDDSGSMLASIHHATEHAFLAEQSAADAWIGLAQATRSALPDANWVWSDGSMGYGVPASAGVRPWDAGEPNDGATGGENDMENCGLLLSPARSSLFDDRGCNANLPFICERAWSY